MSVLARGVATAERWLSAIYRLELDLRAERFVMAPEEALRWLPPGSPRSGIVVVEEDGTLHLGLYLDARDASDPAAIFEETSHLVCVAWHAAHDRPVSRLVLELQAEIDRYATARIAGMDAFAHFRGVVWDGALGAVDRARYELAHRAAHRYCRRLQRRFPRRADTPALLDELRRFYRVPAQAKLRLARSA